jgi:ribosomal protein S18 acetylase RimI-like enzyme
MKTTNRNYSEEMGDFYRLAHFFMPGMVTRRTHTTWCLGRLVDWKYSLFEKKRAYTVFCNENAHLWLDAFGELAGFVISEGGDTEFQILSLPGFRFLFEEMLEWVLDAWQERPAKFGNGFSTEVTEYQTLEKDVLERYGFHLTDEFYTRRFDLTAEIASRLPLEQGFKIVDMHSHPDYRAQAILRANAFQNKDVLSEEEIENRLQFYNHNKAGPIYHPQTDLCVMAEDGKLVSGCEALINVYDLEADIERVCTHNNFRQRGFARVVIQECLFRLREMGIVNAYITGYSQEAMALYGSLGAIDEVKSFVYEKK